MGFCSMVPLPKSSNVVGGDDDDAVDAVPVPVNDDTLAERIG